MPPKAIRHQTLRFVSILFFLTLTALTAVPAVRISTIGILFNLAVFRLIFRLHLFHLHPRRHFIANHGKILLIRRLLVQIVLYLAASVERGTTICKLIGLTFMIAASFLLCP